MSAIDRSTLTCPVCNEPLLKVPGAAKRVIMWCGFGPCRSRAANDGASGLSEEEAHEHLKRYIEEEENKP
jgi:ssDNA-binding Zn-finger/Zn-ribbon topoisomerase 1